MQQRNIPRSSAAIQAALENTILKGLALEWENIHGLLDDEWQALLQPPFFGLFDGRNRNGGGVLAAWDNDTRTIKFRRSFVMAADWNSIVDVLRHEMAHQLASAFHGATIETAHGPGFRKACAVLQADPAATAPYIPRPQQILSDDHRRERKQDRLIRKVKLLMQLAESSNPNEAAQASAKASELILKYNLDLLAKDEHREFVSVYLGQPALRHPNSTLLITHLLERHYFVKVVWISAYVLEKGKMGRVPEASGTVANIQIAAYVFDYLKNTIDACWKSYRGKTGAPAHAKNSFARGVVEGFTQKLDKIKEKCKNRSQDTRTGHAVVKLDDAQLNHYVESRYRAIRSFSRKTRHDRDVHTEGKKIGNTLVIARGIAHRTDAGKKPPRLTVLP